MQQVLSTWSTDMTALVSIDRQAVTGLAIVLTLILLLTIILCYLMVVLLAIIKQGFVLHPVVRFALYSVLPHLVENNKYIFVMLY